MIYAIILVSILFLFVIFYRSKFMKIKKKKTNALEVYEKWRSKSKRDIVREIISVAGQINRGPGIVNPDFKKEIRSMGKKKLLRTLLVLKRALTKKNGGK